MKHAKDKTGNGTSCDLPFATKLAGVIRDMPLRLVQEKCPHELTQALKKTLENLGIEFAAEYAQIYSPLIKRFQDEFQGVSFANAFEHVVKIINETMCNNSTFSATVPVVLKRFDMQKPEVIGSGVLVRIVDRTFVLTAAHVIDRQEHGTLLIPGEHGFMPMTGRFASTPLPASGVRSDDNLDMAYCCLDNECASTVDSRCVILGRQDLSLEPKLASRTNFTFAGFPWRRSNVTGGRIGTESQTFTGIEAKPSEYKAMGLSRDLHIAIRFHCRRTFLQRTRKRVMAPQPDGMSGGGVYVWTENALKASPVRLPLAGIAHTYEAKRSLLIATRLHVYFACIFYNQPGLVKPLGSHS
jgi:hypothetical protein